LVPLKFLFSRWTRTLFEQARYISVKMIGRENNSVLTPWVSTTWCIFSGREHATFLREIISANVLQTKDIISCEAWITVWKPHDPLDRIYDGLRLFVIYSVYWMSVQEICFSFRVPRTASITNMPLNFKPQRPNWKTNNAIIVSYANRCRYPGVKDRMHAALERHL